MRENMQANSDAFVGMFDYIAVNSNSVKKTMSFFIAGFVLFLILGIIAYVIHRMG